MTANERKPRFFLRMDFTDALMFFVLLSMQNRIAIESVPKQNTAILNDTMLAGIVRSPWAKLASRRAHPFTKMAASAIHPRHQTGQQPIEKMHARQPQPIHWNFAARCVFGASSARVPSKSSVGEQHDRQRDSGAVSAVF